MDNKLSVFWTNKYIQSAGFVTINIRAPSTVIRIGKSILKPIHTRIFKPFLILIISTSILLRQKHITIRVSIPSSPLITTDYIIDQTIIHRRAAPGIRGPRTPSASRNLTNISRIHLRIITSTNRLR